ncbi:MAG: sigma 54-interacting transcriptional regulator [Verrucomicrobiota bacterium]
MAERHACSGGSCALAKEGPSLELLGRTIGVNCRSVQELSLMFAIGQTLERSFDLSEIMRPVLRRMRDLMGMERGTIAIVNRDDGEILLSEAIGLPQGVSAQAYFDLILPHLERTVEKGEPVVAPRLSEWLRTYEEAGALADWLKLSPETGLVSVPLKYGDEVIGTISVERQHNPELGWEADLRLLGMIASIIGQAARLRQDAAEQIHSLRKENTRLQEAIAHDFRPAHIIGTASSMRSVYYHIEQVAQSVTTVLIRGESGTGKELVAKALHERSDRSRKAFVKFNCAALPDSIIESELFGHEKGAFTGALSMRKGRFELAEGGTIFLDEIGDISATTQVKLLRVLQEREFERVGSQETKRVDVRVLAATSRDLEAMMADGRFREDLYYRLNVFPIYMPPLRDRKCDVLLLADHFIEKYAKRQGLKPTRISSAAIDLLVSYHWPGNVRELENCIERAVLLSKGQSIKAHHLPPTLQKKTAKEKRETATLSDAVDALEREMIVDTLKDTGSNMAEAARRLGLTERKMGLRVKKYEIDLMRFK